ncbi:MAG: cytochrome c [Gemmatimonadota bacterium]
MIDPRSGVRSKAAAFLTSVVALLTLAPALAAQADAPPFTAEQAEAGSEAYRSECAMCHGLALEGTVAPPLVGNVFRTNWYAGDRTLGDLFDHIANSMPLAAPGSLTDGQYAAITAFLLERNGHPAGDEPLVADLEALDGYTLAPPEDAEEKEEGR